MEEVDGKWLAHCQTYTMPSRADFVHQGPGSLSSPLDPLWPWQCPRSDSGVGGGLVTHHIQQTQTQGSWLGTEATNLVSSVPWNEKGPF